MEHLCRGGWTDGPVHACPHHQQAGTPAPDIRPYDDRRTRRRTEGVASTGQVSKQGTVTHIDHWSGRVAVIARPAPVVVKLKDQPWFRARWEWRDGQWVNRETGEANPWINRLQQKNPPPSSLPSKLNGSHPRTAPATPGLLNVSAPPVKPTGIITVHHPKRA